MIPFWKKILILSFCFLSLLGCSSIVRSGKAVRRSYYFYSLKFQKEEIPTKKIPLKLGVYPITSDVEFQSKMMVYRDGKIPDKISRYSGVYYSHRWTAPPPYLVDELVQLHLAQRVESCIPYPTIGDAEQVIQLHLKHFEEFQGEKESTAVVELQYFLFDDNGELWQTGSVRKEKKYPTDPGQLNNMVNSLSSCTQGCLEEVLKKIAKELEL